MKPNVIPSDRSDGFVIIIGERSNFELTLARDCLSPHSSHRNEATRLNIYTVVFAVTSVRVVSLYFLLTRFNPRLKRGQSIGVNGVSRANSQKRTSLKCVYLCSDISAKRNGRDSNRGVFLFSFLDDIQFVRVLFVPKEREFAWMDWIMKNLTPKLS